MPMTISVSIHSLFAIAVTIKTIFGNPLKIIYAFIFGLSVSALPALADSATHSPPLAKKVWAISMDNDLFVPLTTRDRDFTGGMALTFSEAGGNENWRPLDALLGRIDRKLMNDIIMRPADTRSMEFGFYGFTPDAIEKADPVLHDRPYASLVYFSTSRMYPRANGNSISTSLTLGILGSDVVGSAQNELHRWLGNQSVKGWRHQISDGGEITARYQIAQHHYWKNQRADVRYKTTVFSSLGYLTEVGVALSSRRGLISSPDHRFNPELISYGERVNDAAATPYQGKENYFWGGIALKARLYNAFLQGQFRSSAHTLDYSDLRPLIAEAWLGYTLTIGRDYKVSYVMRAQSSEIKGGTGDRGHVWGGLVLSRSM